jgi:accessory colonization factor AcfD
MWINFKPDSEKILQNPLNSWTLGHEVGHNVNEAPFFVYGACEVVNNLLALYSQDKHLGKMKGVEFGIRTAPELVAAEKGHAWTMSGGGSRLLMYAQLKIWAEQEFDISQWYDSSSLPAYYNNSPVMKGWNMFKLMHRLTRNETESSINLKGSNKCYGQNLKSNDNLMLCSSYVAQKDLTDFFTQWNPGEKSNFIPGLTEPKYRSGISQAGKDAVAALKLPKPTLDPLTINSLKP